MKPWLLVGSLSCLTACASFGTFAGTGEGEVQYGADADENMKKGNEAMESKNYAEASAYFEFVKTKFPYLELSKEAELRLADSDFERERFVEARDRYQNFVRLHPTHPKVDYAAYRAALTHYKDIPSDFFLLPPAAEKDQVEVKNAMTTMSEFVRLHPDSEHVSDARKVIDEVKLRLAEHELAVAKFYANRERWPAVVMRLTVVERFYGGLGLDEQVAFGLYEAHLKLQEPVKAKEALEAYVSKYPKGGGVNRAQRELAKLGGVSAPLPASAADAGT